MPQNIFFIMADQFRADCIGYDGNPYVVTPNINQLAFDSIFFKRGYSPCPVCVPARACCITGLKPSKTGFFNNDFTIPWKFKNTVVERLRNSGYQTINIGKNHFKPVRSHLGYEINHLYETGLSEDGIPSEYHKWLKENGPAYINDTAMVMNHNSWEVRPWTAPKELHPTEWTVTDAIEQVRRRDPDRSLFMKISFHRPHPPIDPPEVYWNIYKDAYIPGPAVGDWAPKFDSDTDCLTPFEGKINDKMLLRARRGYYAQIEHIDSQIGRFIDFLKSVHLYDDAFIVFTSDHGELLGDHNMFRKGPPFEGSSRIPFIIKFPKEMNMRGIKNVPVSLLDFAPTFLDLAGIPIPKEYDGISLFSLLANEDLRLEIIGECYRKNKLITTGGMFVVSERFKYVWNSWKGVELLFDLKNDPTELCDISQDNKFNDILRQMRRVVIEEYKTRPEDQMVDGMGNLIKERILPHYRKPY